LFANNPFKLRVYGEKLSGKRIIGDPKLFSLEERIFNTVCVIAFTTLCFEVPFNFFIKLYVPASLCLFGVFFSIYLYYLSRVKRRSSVAIKLFCTVCTVLFAVNYFFNSGIVGPNLLLFSLTFLLVIAVIPKAHFKFWIPVNVISVLSILVIEYYNPQLAPDVYVSQLSKVIDFAITYLVVVTLTYFAISYIRKNYNFEKEAVLSNNMAIEEQKKELERLNAEKDKLFSIVTHDIRTPLASIQGYLELLTEVNLDENERMALKKQLLQITRDSSDMLTNVLSWSRTQMEGAHAELVVIDIKKVLESSLNIEKNISTKKGVTLLIHSEEGLNFLSDKDMLQLILRNLVNNAIKFTPAGGLVQINAAKEGESCCIKIIDNGLGIDQLQQEKLFQFKASSTYGTNAEKGIGLGLLLCKEFTLLQGGEIWFESTLGKGSTFYLSFKLV
jgi:two-component system sensor histidine kinase/response regulator